MLLANNSVQILIKSMLILTCLRYLYFSSVSLYEVQEYEAVAENNIL